MGIALYYIFVGFWVEMEIDKTFFWDFVGFLGFEGIFVGFGVGVGFLGLGL